MLTSKQYGSVDTGSERGVNKVLKAYLKKG
jgi:hypothetical protein